MTSTNDGKDVKINQTSGQKGKTYYIELYKSLDAQLNGEGSLSERVAHLGAAWQRVHTLCLHSAPPTHPHLLSWIQRHTARAVLQSEWQSPNSKEEHTKLDAAISEFIQECQNAVTSRDGTVLPWESQLLARARWFQSVLSNPWEHPVLKALLEGKPTSTDEILEWLKEERGVVFAARLRQLALSKCDDLALTLLTPVMDHVRASKPVVSDLELVEEEAKETPEPKSTEPTFESILSTEAGFAEVWDVLTDMECVLLHKSDRNARLIELAKVMPLGNGYQVVERLLNRLEAAPKEKRLWKNAKDVATLITQVMITRCMVIPRCHGVVRTALYWMGRALVRAVAGGRLARATATLAAPARSARHLHTLATAVHAQQSAESEELKPFVVELYVRAITFGMNELEKLKLKPEYEEVEARSTEQTLASWFIQLGHLLSHSARMKCECVLTAFSVHPSPAMYERIKTAPPLPAVALDTTQTKQEPETKSEFGSWANDSRSQTNFVKTSEHLNIQQTQHQANVLSTAILNEGEALGLDAELCQDIIVLLSGPRVKTLSWDMDRKLLLENCRVYMERTESGTRALTTELKYLNLDPKQYQHLPEDQEDEDDVYYGIEKGYEHLVELEPQPEEIWEDAYYDFERTDSANSGDEQEVPIRRKKKTKPLSSDSDEDPLSLVAEKKDKKKERPHSKERSKERKKKTKDVDKKDVKDKEKKEKRNDEPKEKKKEKKERKKREKKPKNPLVGLKVQTMAREDAQNFVNVSVASDLDNQDKEDDERVVYDGHFSMDELKSPERKEGANKDANSPHNKTPQINPQNQSLYEESLVAAKQIAATALHNAQMTYMKQMSLNTPGTDQTKSPATNTAPMNHIPNMSRSKQALREEVKKGISKLIQFRRQKNSESSSSPMSSPGQVASSTAITTSPLTALVGAKVVGNVVLNKNQHDQLTTMKNEVNSFKAIVYPQKKEISTCSRVQPFSPLFAKSNPRFHSQTNINSQSNISSSQSNEALNLSQPNPVILNKQLSSSNQLSQNQGCQSVSEPTEKSPRIGDSTHMSSYEKFLQELQRNANAGLDFGVTPVKSPPRQKKKQMRPVSKVTPVIPHSFNAASNATSVSSVAPNVDNDNRVTNHVQNVITEPRVTHSTQNVVQQEPMISPQCAKPAVQPKKVENAPNTFARLRYMHNNKLQDKFKQNWDSATTLENSISEEIDRRIAEFRVTKKKVLNTEYAASRVNAALQKPEPSKVEVQKIETEYTHNTFKQQQHPLLSNILKNPGVTVKSSNSAQNVTQKPVIITKTKTTALTEKDQQELLKLLGQQNLLNRPQSKFNAQPNTVANTSQFSNNYSSFEPNKCVGSASSLQPNRTATPKPVSVQEQAPAIENKVKTQMHFDGTGFSFPVIPNTTIMKTAAMIQNKSANSQRKKKQKALVPVIAAEQNKTVLEVNKEITKKYVPKPPVPATKFDTDVEQDWTKVLDAIRAHKTPIRGPNALDMVLNKDSFEKVNERNQAMNSLSVTKVTNTLKQTPPQTAQVNRQMPLSEPPKPTTSNSHVLQNRSALKKNTAEIPKKASAAKNIAPMNPVILYPEVTKQLQTHELQKEIDPFISGIPNADYEILDELMDDDLRQEIGELSSDEESYASNNASAKCPKNNENKNVSTTKKITHKQNLGSWVKPNEVNISISGELSKNAKAKPQIISNVKVDARKWTKNLIGSKIHRQEPTTMASKLQSGVVYNVNNTLAPSTITSTTTSTMIFNTPPQPTVPSMVIVDPYGISSNVNQTYVAVNNTSNIVYQRFTAPVVAASQIIIGTNFIPTVTTPAMASNVVFNNNPQIIPTNIPIIQARDANSMQTIPVQTSIAIQNNSTNAKQCGSSDEQQGEIMNQPNVDSQLTKKVIINVQQGVSEPKKPNKVIVTIPQSTSSPKLSVKVPTNIHQCTSDLKQTLKSPINIQQIIADKTLPNKFSTNLQQHSTVDPKLTKNVPMNIQREVGSKIINKVPVNIQRTSQCAADPTKKIPVKIEHSAIDPKLFNNVEVNANKISDRKVLSEVQEKQTKVKVETKVPEKIDPVNIKNQKPFCESEKIKEECRNKERLINKRLAIVHRNISHRSILPTIALPYIPLLAFKTHETKNANVSKLEHNNQTVVGSQNAAKLTSVNAQNNKGNEANDPCRRILLRSSNKIDNSVVAPKSNEKLVGRKTKVRLKDTVLQTPQGKNTSPVSDTTLNDIIPDRTTNIERTKKQSASDITNNMEGKFEIPAEKSSLPIRVSKRILSKKIEKSKEREEKSKVNNTSENKNENIAPVTTQEAVDIEDAILGVIIPKSNKALGVTEHTKSLNLENNLTNQTNNKEQIDTEKIDVGPKENENEVIDIPSSPEICESGPMDTKREPDDTEKTAPTAKRKPDAKNEQVNVLEDSSQKDQDNADKVDRSSMAESKPVAAENTGLPVENRFSVDSKMNKLVDDIESAICAITESAIRSPLLETLDGKELIDDVKTLEQKPTAKEIPDASLAEDTSKEKINEIVKDKGLTKSDKDSTSHNTHFVEDNTLADSMKRQEPKVDRMRIKIKQSENLNERVYEIDRRDRPEVKAVDDTYVCKVSRGIDNELVKEKSPLNPTKEHRSQMGKTKERTTAKSNNNKAYPNSSENEKLVTEQCELTTKDLASKKEANVKTMDIESMTKDAVQKMGVNTKVDSVKSKHIQNKTPTVTPSEDRSVIENTDKDVISLSSGSDQDKITCNKDLTNTNFKVSQESTNTVPQSYKDSIKIEEIPLPGNTNPLKRCVRIVLPNDKIFKATVHGKVNVSFDTLFEEPALKNILLSSFSDRKRYFVNIQQLGTKQHKIIDTKIQGIENYASKTCVKSKTPAESTEVVNLVSDDEDDPYQIIKTASGSFKVKIADKDVLKKHQEKLMQNCTIKLNRCDEKRKTEVLVQALLEDLALTTPAPSDVIEIDDSSDGESSQESGIDVLKNMLLKDLGVINPTENKPNNELKDETTIVNERPSRTRKSKYHRERDPRTGGIETKKHTSSQPKRSGSRNTSRDQFNSQDSDKLTEQNSLQTITRDCFVKLVKCDNLVKEMREAQLCEDAIQLDDVAIAPFSDEDIPAMSRSGSFSILNELDTLEEPLVSADGGSSPVIRVFETIHALYNLSTCGKNSPVMEAYDMIIALQNKPKSTELPGTHKSESNLLCNSDWFETKRCLHVQQLIHKTRTIDDIFHEIVVNKLDTSTDCETDATTDLSIAETETIYIETFSVPSLTSIMSKYFEDNPILHHMKPIANANVLPKTPLKRKLQQSAELALNKVTKMSMRPLNARKKNKDIKTESTLEPNYKDQSVETDDISVILAENISTVLAKDDRRDGEVIQLNNSTKVTDIEILDDSTIIAVQNVNDKTVSPDSSDEVPETMRTTSEATSPASTSCAFSKDLPEKNANNETTTQNTAEILDKNMTSDMILDATTPMSPSTVENEATADQITNDKKFPLENTAVVSDTTVISITVAEETIPVSPCVIDKDVLTTNANHNENDGDFVMEVTTVVSESTRSMSPSALVEESSVTNTDQIISCNPIITEDISMTSETTEILTTASEVTSPETTTMNTGQAAALEDGVISEITDKAELNIAIQTSTCIVIEKSCQTVQNIENSSVPESTTSFETAIYTTMSKETKPMSQCVVNKEPPVVKSVKIMSDDSIDPQDSALVSNPKTTGIADIIPKVSTCDVKEPPASKTDIIITMPTLPCTAVKKEPEEISLESETTAISNTISKVITPMSPCAVFEKDTDTKTDLDLRTTLVEPENTAQISNTPETTISEARTIMSSSIIEESSETSTDVDISDDSAVPENTAVVSKTPDTTIFEASVHISPSTNEKVLVTSPDLDVSHNYVKLEKSVVDSKTSETTVLEVTMPVSPCAVFKEAPPVTNLDKSDNFVATEKSDTIVAETTTPMSPIVIEKATIKNYNIDKKEKFLTLEDSAVMSKKAEITSKVSEHTTPKSPCTNIKEIPATDAIQDMKDNSTSIKNSIVGAETSGTTTIISEKSDLGIIDITLPSEVKEATATNINWTTSERSAVTTQSSSILVAEIKETSTPNSDLKEVDKTVALEVPVVFEPNENLIPICQETISQTIMSTSLEAINDANLKEDSITKENADESKMKSEEDAPMSMSVIVKDAAVKYQGEPDDALAVKSCEKSPETVIAIVEDKIDKLPIQYTENSTEKSSDLQVEDVTSASNDFSDMNAVSTSTALVESSSPVNYRKVQDESFITLEESSVTTETTMKSFSDRSSEIIMSPESPSIFVENRDNETTIVETKSKIEDSGEKTGFNTDQPISEKTEADKTPKKGIDDDLDSPIQWAIKSQITEKIDNIEICHTSKCVDSGNVKKIDIADKNNVKFCDNLKEKLKQSDIEGMDITSSVTSPQTYVKPEASMSAVDLDENYVYETEIVVEVQNESNELDKITESPSKLDQSQSETTNVFENDFDKTSNESIDEEVEEEIIVEKIIEEVDCDENVFEKNATLVYKDDSGVILKGVEYVDPEMGTCYVFPLVKSSDESVATEVLNSSIGSTIEVIQEIEVTTEEDNSEIITDLYDAQDLKVIRPKQTYSKRNLKRKSNMEDVTCSQKRSRRSRSRESTELKVTERKYRKGKNIDVPKLSATAIAESGNLKDFKRRLDYYSTVGFSYSITFSTEFVDATELLCKWPINGPIKTEMQNEDVDEPALFADLDNNENHIRDPLRLTLMEEITADYNKPDYPSQKTEETNFNMGFGEGSDRAIQNLDGGTISNYSAATLSDVKHDQPCLLSEKYDDSEKKHHFLNASKHEQLQTIKRHLNYMHLKEKVRSFFKNTTYELSRELEENLKDSTENYDASSFPFELFNSKCIEPFPTETVVQVVQVGQLPVSAAAQNPVTCDPRVTQVSDASPSQCSVENSPHDDSQPEIKTEYTELTTADLNLPLDGYAHHNQTLPMDSQNTTNISIDTENIPIETELVKSEVKIEIVEETAEEKENNELCEATNHVNNVEYLYNANNVNAPADSEFQALFNSDIKQDAPETSVEQKSQNGSSEKTDQIAHAMNAAGITTTSETASSRAQALVNILAQKLRQGALATTPNSANNYPKATSINAMSLQQALASILPPPLNQTNSTENNQQGQNTVTPQVLHIVQGKNATGNQITLVDNSQQSVITNPNATPVLHIVQNKAAASGQNANGSPAPQSSTFSGLSLVDAGLQQGGNQLLHIVNTGNQKNNSAAGQLLKRVNLLTNLTNVQGSNEQKMVQFVCKSADGKSIQLNAPHQRSMVLRLQPIESPNVQPPATPKPPETNQDLSPTQTTTNSATNKDSAPTQQEIKSRSVYEENYAKFIQNSSNKPTLLEKSNSLPKFNQAFGKAVFQDGNQKQNEMNSNSLPSVNTSTESSECPASDNAINLDHIGRIGSPPLLLRKPSPQTTQAQPNLVQQIKQTIAPMNIQTMHGGVIYTRQIPVNIGGGQTINLITVPSTELMDESGQKQQVNQGEPIEPSIIKIVPQSQPSSNAEVSDDMNNDNAQQSTPQPQPVLTQMRIKLPMLSKAPQMVSGTRVVRPSFFQIQRNVIGGGNQAVYQQLVLTAAPPLGQQTIRLPQTQARQIKVPENQSSSESQMSSSTLEQLREFDMVLEQVKERSTVQPNSNSVSNFKLHTSSTDTTDSPATATSTSVEAAQVLYSLGSSQPLNVTYVNRKPSVATTSTFVRSPDSSGIADSPTSSSHSHHIPHTSTSEASSSEATTHHQKPAKVSSKSRSRPKSSSHGPNSMKLNSVASKSSTQKPLEDEQTTQRILYILAEYKEQVENSPDKDKPAPRRRSNPPSNPGSGSSKRKKSSSGSRRSGRDSSPIHGDDTCRTMGSEDSSCGTSQGDCNESCMDSHSPQDSPRKVARKLAFDQDPPTPTQPRPQPQRNVIVADGQTITVARGTAGKPTTTVLMPTNYILPVSMVKGGQQIAIVTNRGPKLLTVGGGEGGATNALLLQRLIGPAGLKPVLTRPGVRHVRLPTAALHNLQAFNLATTTSVNPTDSSSSTSETRPGPIDANRTGHSPWTDRESEIKPDRASSPDEEPWNLPTSADPHDYSYEETVRTDNMDRTVLDPIQDRYSPDMEAQRIFDKMFDVDAKKSYIVDSPRCGYDIDASDCDDKPYQVVHKKDNSHRQTRLSHVSAAALRHKYAILEHELRLQKSLSEECEDLGVDSPSASELFPEAELLFAASPAQDHGPETPQHSHTPQPTLLNQSVIQPDIDDQIATDQLLPRHNVPDERQDLGLGLEDVGIVTVSEDGMQATIALDQEEFARAHPNTTFHTEPPSEEGEVQPFTIAGLKGRHITSTIFHSNRAPATVLMTTPQTTVISQATAEAPQNPVKYADIDNMIHSIPSTHTNNINLSSVLVKDDGLTRFDNVLTDSRELHLSNTASAIVHSAGNATQVIRRVCYDNSKRERESFLMDEPDALIAGDDAKMIAEDSSRDATLESMGGDIDDENSSPERHAELFWESNSASERSESRRPLEFSSDSEKCCKSPSYDETNSTDSSGVGTHMRLDSVIKEARGIERSGSADGSSADDTHPPLRTYPPKRLYQHVEGEMERSLSGKTRAGERSPDLEVRRRASGRGVVKRGCHCCNGSPAPPRPKKPRQRKPTLDFTN